MGVLPDSDIGAMCQSHLPSIRPTISFPCQFKNKEDEEMDSWVLSTFLVLTVYMLVHSGAAYMRRELKRKRKEQREKQRG